jgi:hypothetical protein
MLRFYSLDEKKWKRWECAASECKRQLGEQQITPSLTGGQVKATGAFGLQIQATKLSLLLLQARHHPMASL